MLLRLFVPWRDGKKPFKQTMQAFERPAEQNFTVQFVNESASVIGRVIQS